MTGKQFTTWAEAVYGKYTPAMKLEVENWLEDYNELWVEALRPVVLEAHPSTFRIPPGVHELFKLRLDTTAAFHRAQEPASAAQLPAPREIDFAAIPDEAFQEAWAKIMGKVKETRERVVDGRRGKEAASGE